VLVVDDERAIRALCRVNLELGGFEVVAASNGAEALGLAERNPPDIVLLDVMMPELDGWQVAERLRSSAATREVPVVFLSARASHADKEHGFESGAVAYVVKPFDPVALPDVLVRVLDRLARGERDALREEMLDA
jgi:DNA-binding response OmpR family regulator